MPRRKRKAADETPEQAFARRVVAAGGEQLAATNPYEVARVRTRLGTGVIYRNARGRITWNAEAQAIKAHLDENKGSLAPVIVHGRQRSAGMVQRLLERDREGCFFCRLVLAEDITIEHLVPVAHGGPNHISNLFLAHESCNLRAGHLSAPEKIAIREKATAALNETAPDLLLRLCEAEAFMAGFEGDEMQEGIDDKLAAVRTAITKAEGRA